MRPCVQALRGPVRGEATQGHSATTVRIMRRGQVQNYLTPSLVIGTCLSLISAFALLLFDITDFGVSFLIGLTGTTMAAVIDLLDRTEYASLFRTPAWLRHEIARLGVAAQAAVSHGATVLDEELQAVIARAAGDVEMLANGRMERNASDTRHMLTVTAAASRRIAAVTTVNQRDDIGWINWWSTDFGKRYWQANIDAIRRGVEIHRVFVYDELNDKLSALAAEQRRAGVKVYLISAADITPPYRANVIVWDDTCTWEVRMDAFASITGNVFSYNRLDLARCRELVETLIVRAREGEDDISEP